MAGSIHEQLLDELTTGRVVAAIFLFLAGSLIVDFTWKPTYPSQIPIVGYGKGTVAGFRNFFGYIIHYRDWVKDGYEKYSKHGRAFIVPSAASRPPDIVLPRSQTMWLFDHPDDMVSTHHAHNDILYSEYNFLGKAFSDDVFHTRVIHKSLARHLNVLIPGMEEEVNNSMEEVFGTDTEEWKTINLWDAWLGIVPKVTNRMLIGEGVCRSEKLKTSMVAFVDIVVRNCFLLNMVPKIIHPIVAPLVTLPNWWQWRAAAQVVLPTIKQRLHDMERKDAGDPAYEDWIAPVDFITWIIRLAKIEGKAAELDPYSISKRLLPIEFAAIHTTVLTGHSVVLDLLSSDPSQNYVEGIKEEATRVLKEEGGHWTKNGLSRLYRLDSAIRESQRLSNFSTTLVERKVIAKEGVTNQHEGWHVPYGTFITLNLQGVHHDDDLYAKANNYDAFRISRQREEYEAKALDERDPEELMRLKKLGMVTTSDMHLAFGHGRHACPGRFFVAHELKMVIAYLLLNYDIKPIGERPQPQWIGATIIPPLAASIQIRRRKDAIL